MLTRWEAEELGEQLRQTLSGCVERWELVGDARREQNNVEELGVVVIRATGPEGEDLLAERLTELGRQDPPEVVPVEWRPDGRRMFHRQKQVRSGFYQQALFVRWCGRWERVNIWVADRDNWGLIVLLRTGGRRFVWSVTQGLREKGLVVHGGRVRRLLRWWQGMPIASRDIPERDLGPAEACHDEQAVCALAGRKWWPAHQRM